MTKKDEIIISLKKTGLGFGIIIASFAVVGGTCLCVGYVIKYYPTIFWIFVAIALIIALAYNLGNEILK